MKLVGSLTSPYVRKTRIVLLEKRINYTFEVAVPWDAGSPVADYNPLGKVPVLIMEDGTPLYDSRVIVEYLDNISPVSRLIPESNRHRIMVKRWEVLADGVSEPPPRFFWNASVPPPSRVRSGSCASSRRSRGAWKRPPTNWALNKWCNGSAYTLADVALGCTLGYLTFRFPEVEWRTAFPNLADLADKLEKRASFVETAPKG